MSHHGLWWCPNLRNPVQSWLSAVLSIGVGVVISSAFVGLVLCGDIGERPPVAKLRPVVAEQVLVPNHSIGGNVCFAGHERREFGLGQRVRFNRFSLYVFPSFTIGSSLCGSVGNHNSGHKYISWQLLTAFDHFKMWFFGGIHAFHKNNSSEVASGTLAYVNKLNLSAWSLPNGHNHGLNFGFPFNGFATHLKFHPRTLVYPHLTLDGLNAIFRSSRLRLENGNLLLSSDASGSGIPSGLLRSDLQQIGLTGRFLELLIDGERSNAGRNQGNGSNSYPPFSKRDGLSLERTEFIVFNNPYYQWFIAFWLAVLSGLLTKISADILLGGGWSGRIDSLYRRCSGRSFTDRERVFISCGCFVSAVAIGVHAILIILPFSHEIVPQKSLDILQLLGYSNVSEASMANVLNTDKQIAVIGALTEGSSIRSIERITGVHRDTIMRLGVKVGQGCAAVMDSKMRDLPCNRLEMDEIWGFVGKKERQVREGDSGVGSVWTFCAIDADTKLVPAFKVGDRSIATATAFVRDVASRMSKRVQISTDGLHAYVGAIESAFGSDVDYAQIVKVYGQVETSNNRRYSAPEFVSSEKKVIVGNPNERLISTSYVERLNATTRLHMRRLTRLTLAFSKKRENFEAAVALHFAYYNFVKRHNTIRCTPAMAAGVERNFWSVGDLVEAAA